MSGRAASTAERCRSSIGVTIAHRRPGTPCSRCPPRVVTRGAYHAGVGLEVTYREGHERCRRMRRQQQGATTMRGDDPRVSAANSAEFLRASWPITTRGPSGNWLINPAVARRTTTRFIRAGPGPMRPRSPAVPNVSGLPNAASSARRSPSRAMASSAVGCRDRGPPPTRPGPDRVAPGIGRRPRSRPYSLPTPTGTARTSPCAALCGEPRAFRGRLPSPP